MNRRAFLLAGGSMLLGAGVPWPAVAAARAEKDVTIVEFNDAGIRLETVRVPKLVKTDAEWRARLSDISYQVTRRAQTERPFTGPLLYNHEAGLYRCLCCDTALFSSDTKF